MRSEPARPSPSLATASQPAATTMPATRSPLCATPAPISCPARPSFIPSCAPSPTPSSKATPSSSKNMADSAPLTVRELKALEAIAGRTFASLVVIKKLAVKTASNGNAFLSLELGDRTGSFSCTVFGDNPLCEPIKAAGEGAVLRIEGKVDYFQGRFSPRLQTARIVSEDELA